MHRVATALLLVALTPAVAVASQQGVNVMKRWKQVDICTQKAQAEFPDFTPEGNAKRDAKLKECLAGQNLPPRDPQSPPR